MARGAVDLSDPPIAGLGSISASDGLTEQFLYDDNLSDDAGLDSTTGLSLLVGSGSVSLSAALAKLADTEVSGGAVIAFSSTAPGSARVSVSPSGEVSFSIADAAGRSVMSGMLEPPGSSSAGDLITWSCTRHDTTSSLTGFGTVLETRSIDALGNVRRSLSDAAGRTLQSIDALGEITAFTYDPAGNQLSVLDPNGVGQSCLYDALGRDVSCTDTASAVTTSAYDAAGNKVASTDAKSNTTTYAFDARGRQVSQTDRLTGVTAFAYTASGQLASLTDAENQVTGYLYDDAGNKLEEVYPDHVTSSIIGSSGYGKILFSYDAVGRTLVRTDQQGDTCSFDYDLAGRLASRAYAGHASGPLASVTDSDTFTYDDSSRMLTAVSGRYSNTVTYTYDSAGRKETESLTISGQTYTSETEYDEAGQVSKLTYPDSSEVIRTYTDRGQLATLAVGSTTIDTRSYDDGGRMTASSYNNGVSESRAYNTDNTLASISFTGAAVGDLSYGWDANKNKTSETIGGTMSGYGFAVGSSGYDDEDRLVNWQRTDTNLDQSWDLSLVGNWDTYTENASAQSRTHGPTHELLTVASQGVTHDAKGNMTLIPAVLRPSSDPLKMKWDFENKLIAADTDDDSVDDVFYRFDALGRRVGRDDGTVNVVYFQDGQQTIADYPAGTAAGSPTYTYVYASYIDEPVLRGGSGGLRYYHRNQQYSITALTDGGGSIAERYAYTAYGQVTFTNASGTVQSASASNNRITYTGREWDEGLNLYHYRGRMYDAVAGQFFGRDPVKYVDGFSLYRNYFSPGAMDPYGNLTAMPLQGPLGVCGQTSNSRVQYRLDSPNAPDGYLVQKVIACQVRSSCPQPCNKPPCYPPKDECKLKALTRQDCVEYYEIIWGQGAISVIDNFSVPIPDETCGQTIQLGETRYYAMTVTGKPKAGPIYLPFPTGGGITSIALPASIKKPNFWDTVPPVEGPVFHSFGVSWNCCCDNNSINPKRDFGNQKPTPSQVLQPM